MSNRLSAVLVFALIALSVLIGFCALLFGAKPMTFEAALSAFLRQGSSVDETIVWTLRLPRSAAAFVAGAGLSVSGYLLQAVTRNPLASPDLTGVSAGAVAVIVTFFIFVPEVYSAHYNALGLVGALSAAAMTLWLSKGGTGSPLHLALAGITVWLFLDAITTYVLVRGGLNSPSLLFWLSGGLQGRSWRHLFNMMPWVGAGIIGAFALHRVLALMALSEDVAASMGLRTALWKPVVILLAVLPVAGIAPVAGPIAFIGLAVPHIVRLLRVGSVGWAIALNVAIGGLLVIVADAVARTIAAPEELPLGIATAVIGGPFFIYLALRPTAAIAKAEK